MLSDIRQKLRSAYDDRDKKNQPFKNMNRASKKLEGNIDQIDAKIAFLSEAGRKCKAQQLMRRKRKSYSKKFES